MGSQADDQIAKGIEKLSLAHKPQRLKFFDETYASHQNAVSGASFPVRTNFFDVDITNIPDKVYVYSFTFPLIRGHILKNRNVKQSLIGKVLQQPFFTQNNWRIRTLSASDQNATLVSLLKLEAEPNASFTVGRDHSMQSTVSWANQTALDDPVPLDILLQATHVLDKQAIIDHCAGRAHTDCSVWLDAFNILTRVRATRSIPSHAAVKIGRNKFFHTNQTTNVWTNFRLQGRNGHHVSIRTVGNGLAMNVQAVSTAFVVAQPLLTYLRKESRIDTALNSPNDVNSARNCDSEFRNMSKQLQVRYMYTPPDAATPVRAIRMGALAASTKGRLKRVNGFGGSAHAQMFDHPMHGRISVRRYFNEFILAHNDQLQHPHLLVVNTGTHDHPAWVPPELLYIEPHQPKRGLLSDAEMPWMVRLAQRLPRDNISIIEDVLRTGENFDVIFMQNKRLTVSSTMKQVDARMLPIRDLVYGSGRVDIQQMRDQGKWNLKNMSFVKAGTSLPVLGAIEVGSTATPSLFVPLARNLAGYGIQPHRKNVFSVATPVVTTDGLDRACRNLQVDARQPLKIILVILPSASQDDYATVKTWGDTLKGINTVCITREKVGLLKGLGFQANIALKLNVKLDGENHHLSADAQRELHTGGKTMVIGADVSQPTGGSVTHCPSVAAVVASSDEYAVTYPGSLRLQKSKQEEIEGLDDMIYERLLHWHKKNGSLPQNILVYRDGVSESQFAMVKCHELRRVMLGCEKASNELPVAGPYRPRITLVVCDKRHHTRFYDSGEAQLNRLTQEQKKKLYPNGNFKPGLVVDDENTRSPYHFDFYLQSHRALQGTAKPCHYFVIENGMGLSADQLQRITFNLCWTFATALTPISYASPAYYADRLASRGACYLRPLLVTRHPQRPTDMQLDTLMNAMSNSQNATEDQKAQYFCDQVAHGWRGIWPARPAQGRDNPHLSGVADMFYV